MSNSNGDRTGLQLTGLSRETAEFCRQEHTAFLERHGLSTWPLQISMRPAGSLPDAPQNYLLEVRYGIPRSIWRRITPEPERELREVLNRMLEINFVSHRKADEESN